MSKTRNVCCTNHCRACGGEAGRHFHSVAAFDAHRTGDFSSNDPDTRRRCLNPIEVLDRDGNERLVALSTTGVCTADLDAPQTGVTIWTMREGLERARDHWGSK